MAMVVNNRHRIFYRYEGERGAFLMLHHGLFGSHQDWYQGGYIDALAPDFRLIIPDARGHGRSDRPTDPAQYSPAALADDIIAVMDEMNVHNLHFLGYSLGAMVGFELLTRYPDRMRIVMFCGEAPFVVEDHLRQWSDWSQALKKDGYAAFLANLEKTRWRIPSKPHPLLPEISEELQPAAEAMLTGLSSITPRPRGKISVSSPVALFTADKDPAQHRIVDTRQDIHRARLVSFPNKDHLALFQEREKLLDELHRLLKTGKREDAHADKKGGSATWDNLTPPPPVDVGGGGQEGEVVGEMAAEEETASDPPSAIKATTGDAHPEASSGPTEGQAQNADEPSAPIQEGTSPLAGVPTAKGENSTAPYKDAGVEDPQETSDEFTADENGFAPVRVRSQEEVIRENVEEEGPEYPAELVGKPQAVKYVDEYEESHREDEKSNAVDNHGENPDSSSEEKHH